MLGFTRQEQRFILFLIAAFVVGIGVRSVRVHAEKTQKDTWKNQREQLWAELQKRAAQEKNLEATSEQLIVDKKKTLTDRINLNTATVQDLQVLPRIGPAISQRIIEFRNEYGPFQTVADIQKVKGIGPKTFKKINEYITVDD